ncbi:MAG: iron ABC transporter permease [Spirochaetales bacterium]|nr:iron ABC transporter permease [Spirochaetales bacterium]
MSMKRKHKLTRIRLKNGVKGFFSNPYNILVILTVVLLVYLIVVPLVGMINTTFHVGRTDVHAAKQSEGSFTFYYWNRLFLSKVAAKLLYTPFLNSFIVSICASFLAILLGSVLAWLMVRSNLPHKRFFSTALLVPYMLPSWSLSLAWLSVFKNAKIGGATGFLDFLGIHTPDWIAYGPVAIIIVFAMHYYAYAYLLVAAALKSVNSELEEMGEIAGAPKTMILRRITLPLVLPAVLSAVILTFTKCMGTFGVPSYLGSPVKYYTISTTLYNSMTSGQKGVGFSVAIVLIAFASMNVFINQRIIGKRKSYTTIGGKGGRSNEIDLGKWRKPIFWFIILFLVLFVVFPVVVMSYETFMFRPGDFSVENFTLHHWIGQPDLRINSGEPGILRNSQFYTFLVNTLVLTFLTSVIGTVWGQIIGYINARGRALRSGRLVEQMVFIPYLIPSIAFGAMYLSMFAKAQTIRLFGLNIPIIPSLYGTFTILVLISVVKHLPFASRAGTSNMMQISYELEEAAQIAGAGFFKRFSKIVFPLSKGGFWSGFMLIFISIVKELDLLALLMTPNYQTLPFMEFSFSSETLGQLSNVVTIILFLIVFLVYFLANRFTDADISKGF